MHVPITGGGGSPKGGHNILGYIVRDPGGGGYRSRFDPPGQNLLANSVPRTESVVPFRTNCPPPPQKNPVWYRWRSAYPNTNIAPSSL